jgi:DNA-binding IclR family transcriptional regulator
VAAVIDLAGTARTTIGPTTTSRAAAVAGARARAEPRISVASSRLRTGAGNPRPRDLDLVWLYSYCERMTNAVRDEQTPTTSVQPPRRLLQSTLRCLDVLDALAASDRPVAISDLSRRMSVRRGTLHQQLQTLVYAGWVRQNPDARYYLSLRAVHIGKVALEQAGIAARLLPLLEELAFRTGEAPAIAVLDVDNVLIVQRVESQQLVRADIKVGTRMPLVGSAAGMVLLAYASPEKLAQLADRGVRVPAEERLAEVRTRGYAVQRDGFTPGLSAAAVPISMGDDEELLTLSMAAPTERFDEQRTVDHLLGAVKRFYDA